MGPEEWDENTPVEVVPTRLFHEHLLFMKRVGLVVVSAQVVTTVVVVFVLFGVRC